MNPDPVDEKPFDEDEESEGADERADMDMVEEEADRPLPTDPKVVRKLLEKDDDEIGGDEEAPDATEGGPFGKPG